MSSEKDEETGRLEVQIDNEINLRIVARETTDHTNRTIQVLLSISLAIALFLAYRIYDTRYWVDVAAFTALALGSLPYGLWIIATRHWNPVKVLTCNLENALPQFQMQVKASFWKIKRVAEEEERDQVLKHARRYTILFMIFTPLAMIILALSPITRQEESNERNRAAHHHFPAQSYQGEEKPRGHR